MAKHARSTANQPSQNKRSRIQSWLMQEGWKIGELPITEAALWGITATSDIGHVIIVAQPRQPTDRTIIQASVTVDDDTKRQIAAMSQEKRQEFWWRIRLGLLEMGLEFSGFAEPINLLGVSQRIYDDGLTKDEFLQRVSQVKRGVIFILWMIQRGLQQPPDDSILDAGLIQ
ncbi:MAG TPA: DUF2299 family protein [Pyrinomonadaceae bacterium]|nr:DUF2299 family protein [Pyrinomonadaceae bacterium]